jgi:type III secretory pathway component EscS
MTPAEATTLVMHWSIPAITAAIVVAICIAIVRWACQ